MNVEAERLDLLNKTNPLFNDRKLKLGTFSTNLSGGATISTMEGVLGTDWPTVARLARMADEMGLEAIVPVGRWRGFGGVTDFNGAGFESFTFAAGIAAQTNYSAIFATSHVPSIHPVLASKQATTVDHISGGRFALNIITGWFKSEIEMFGSPLLEHDERYDSAAEWLEILKLLWERDEPINFEGKYYKVRDAILKPHPVQQPRPVVMGAGASRKGKEFAAKYCDVSFTVFESRTDKDNMRGRIESVRTLAREEFKRDIKVWTHAFIFQGETEQDAWQQYNHCVHEKGDWVAAHNMVSAMGMQGQSLSPEAFMGLKEHFIAGYAGFPLIGTKEQIVDGLKMLHELGVDGVLLVWAAFEDGLRQFRDETLPLLVEEGLR